MHLLNRLHIANLSLLVRLSLAVLMVWTTILMANQQDWIPQKLIDATHKKFGRSASRALVRWNDFMVDAAKIKDEDDLLKKVNDFFNREVPYVSDQKHWNKSDYWATPVEALISKGGDCEDYAIAKYYTLVKLGVPAEKLRITYVMALDYDVAHMVLAYYPKPDAIPVVLDNLKKRIIRADKRRDLKPVYSFNAEGLWLETMKNRAQARGNPNELDRWMDLKIRMAGLGLPI